MTVKQSAAWLKNIGLSPGANDMERFRCECGNEIFYDSRFCEVCLRGVAFNPSTLKMAAFTSHESVDITFMNGYQAKKCSNWIDFDTCNWSLPGNSPENLCYACQFNRTIPNQNRVNSGMPVNFFRWRKLEEAKKRTLYTLLSLGIAPVSGWKNSTRGLLFDFLENLEQEKTDAQPITTGYSNGIITINIAEADDVTRVTARSALNERQRTLVGHFRHETGHFFWDRLLRHLPLGGYFHEIFGEEKYEYRRSLNNYYEKGPPRNWHDGFISAYATSHPSEDWAETWNHYLLICECLQTAHAVGMLDPDPAALTLREKLRNWSRLAVTLNQLNRSIGLGDAYPFVITRRIEEKLNYVAAIISSYKESTISYEISG